MRRQHIPLQRHAQCAATCLKTRRSEEKTRRGDTNRSAGTTPARNQYIQLTAFACRWRRAPCGGRRLEVPSRQHIGQQRRRQQRRRRMPAHKMKTLRRIPARRQPAAPNNAAIDGARGTEDYARNMTGGARRLDN
jgi:hypothetical protein